MPDNGEKLEISRNHAWEALANGIMFVVGNGKTSESTDKVMDMLTKQGYRLVNPAAMLRDCPDRWTCCIHERPPKDEL